MRGDDAGSRELKPMGLERNTITCLSYLKERGHIGSQRRVIEIGAQQLSDSFLAAKTELAELGRLFGLSTALKLPDPLDPRWNEPGRGHLRPDAPWAREFYEWLGYQYACVDIDD